MDAAAWRSWVEDTLRQLLPETEALPSSFTVGFSAGQHLVIVFHLDWWTKKETACSALSIPELLNEATPEDRVQLIRRRLEQALRSRRKVASGFESDLIHVQQD